jgi:hypothetical protein
MISDDFFPETKVIAPPEGLSESAQRISNVRILTELAFNVFSSVNTFRSSMSECGYNMELKPLLLGKRIKTYSAIVLAKDGAKWKMILNEVGRHWMQISNVAISAKGDTMTDEEFKTLKEENE